MSVELPKVCVVTGSRADYGLLVGVMRAIERSVLIDLQILAVGSHFSTAHGMTIKAIENDGFRVDAYVSVFDGAAEVDVTAVAANTLLGAAREIERLAPDVLLVLGDRYEIFTVAMAATLLRIPIAHIGGGDLTAGAYDESFRHGLTKMAHLHFVTNPEAARRVRQLGEDPARVHLVGSPGIDYIRTMIPWSRSQLSERLGVVLRERFALVTFHPVTLEPGEARRQVGELLAALRETDPELGIVFTLPNADSENEEIASEIRKFCARNSDRAMAFASMGQEAYLSTMSLASVVLGNSSSGLYEAPSFGVPTVNIGDRQKGRLLADSVVTCKCERESILESLMVALERGRLAVTNPYGDGHSARRLVAALEAVGDYPSLLKKHFFDVEVG